jgi:hypothetical protein
MWHFQANSMRLLHSPWASDMVAKQRISTLLASTLKDSANDACGFLVSCGSSCWGTAAAAAAAGEAARLRSAALATLLLCVLLCRCACR